MKYKNSRPHVHLPKTQKERAYVALIRDNELDYKFASPECPMSLWELEVVLSTRYDAVTASHSWRVLQEGNTFFLIDEYSGDIVEQWTAVHRSALQTWKEVLA